MQGISGKRLLKKITLIAVASACFGTAFGQSYYYRETFETPLGAAQSEWTNEFWYGNQGVVIPTAENSEQLFNNTVAGKLTFRNECNTGDNWRNGYWACKWVWNTNHFSASETRPFGWEIIREFCDLDLNRFGGDPNDARAHCMVGIAMFKDSTPPLHKTRDLNRTYEWETFENYFEFVDHIGDWDNPMKQLISYYDGTEISLNNACQYASSPRGTVCNISNLACWDYNLGGASVANNNPLGFRITHDGTYLKLYINPNPYNTTGGYPNEWLQIA